jgi:hypothetical protein
MTAYWSCVLALSLLMQTAAGVLADELLPLVEQAKAAGVDETRIRVVIQTCRQRKLTSEQTRAALTPVLETARAGLPSGLVLTKIEEGLTKQVDAISLGIAAANRASQLARAHLLVHQTHGEKVCQHDELLDAITHGLESGLPDTVLQALLVATKQLGLVRMLTLLESGEILQLGGVPPAETQALLLDFVKRGLGSRQMMDEAHQQVEKLNNKGLPAGLSRGNGTAGRSPGRRGRGR